MSVAFSGASLSHIMLMMVKKYGLLQDIKTPMTTTKLAVAIEYWLGIFDVFNEWCEIFRKWDKN